MSEEFGPEIGDGDIEYTSYALEPINFDTWEPISTAGWVYICSTVALLLIFLVNIVVLTDRGVLIPRVEYFMLAILALYGYLIVLNYKTRNYLTNDQGGINLTMVISQYIPFGLLTAFLVYFSFMDTNNFIKNGLNLAFEEPITIGVTILVLVVTLLNLSKRTASWFGGLAMKSSKGAIKHITRPVFLDSLIIMICLLIYSFKHPAGPMILTAQEITVMVVAGIAGALLFGYLEYKGIFPDTPVSYSEDTHDRTLRYYFHPVYLVLIGLGLAALICSWIAFGTGIKYQDITFVYYVYFIIIFIVQLAPLLFWILSKIADYLYKLARNHLWKVLVAVTLLLVLKVAIFNSQWFNGLGEFGNWAISGAISAGTWLLLVKYGGGLSV